MAVYPTHATQQKLVKEGGELSGDGTGRRRKLLGRLPSSKPAAAAGPFPLPVWQSAIQAHKGHVRHSHSCTRTPQTAMHVHAPLYPSACCHPTPVLWTAGRSFIRRTGPPHVQKCSDSTGPRCVLGAAQRPPVKHTLHTPAVSHAHPCANPPTFFLALLKAVGAPSHCARLSAPARTLATSRILSMAMMRQQPPMSSSVKMGRRSSALTASCVRAVPPHSDSFSGRTSAHARLEWAREWYAHNKHACSGAMRHIWCFRYGECEFGKAHVSVHIHPGAA